MTRKAFGIELRYDVPDHYSDAAALAAEIGATRGAVTSARKAADYWRRETQVLRAVCIILQDKLDEGNP